MVFPATTPTIELGVQQGSQNKEKRTELIRQQTFEQISKSSKHYQSLNSLQKKQFHHEYMREIPKREENVKDFLEYVIKKFRITDSNSERLQIMAAVNELYPKLSENDQIELLRILKDLETMKQLESFMIKRGYEQEFRQVSLEVNQAIFEISAPQTMNLMNEAIQTGFQTFTLNDIMFYLNRALNGKMDDDTEEIEEKFGKNAEKISEEVQGMKESGTLESMIDFLKNMEKKQAEETKITPGRLGEFIPKIRRPKMKTG